MMDLNNRGKYSRQPRLFRQRACQWLLACFLPLLSLWQLPLRAADTDPNNTNNIKVYLPTIVNQSAATDSTSDIQAATNAGTSITLFRAFQGRLDYLTVGAAQTSTESSCDNSGPRTVALTLPAGSTVQAAYLYWAMSTLANNGDTSVTLNGVGVNAQKTWGESFSAGLLSAHNYSGARADVTALVGGSGNYTVGDLTYYTGNPQCIGHMTLGAWALVVIYANPILPTQAINLYDGFVGQYAGTLALSVNTTQNNILSVNLPTGCTQSVQLTHVSYEGDTTPGEYLSINNSNFGDNTYNSSTAAGLDIDSYNLTSLVPTGASNINVATQNYRVYSFLSWAQELYINNVYLVRYKLCDQDADGIGDSIDQDDDNDGLLDIIEGNGAADTDNDGFPDSRDLDSDNDGLTDVREAAGLDTNGDALSDGTTTTQGVPTSANNGAGLTPQNADSDSVGNWRDLDSDNDGLNDVREGNNPDANNDSFADSPDSDSDGIPNSVDGKTGFGDANDPILPDTDLDSRYSPYDIDSDNDSIPDLFESNNSQLDSNADARADGADTDNDGIVQALDGSPSYGDSLDPITPDTDGDSIGDPYDSDSDDDAIPDYIEAQQGSSYLSLSRHDSDGDGLDDAYDLRP